MPRDEPHPFPPPPGPARRTVVTAGGGVLIAAATAVTVFLGVWEPDPRDPGLVYADRLAGNLPTVCNGITRHVTSTPVIVGERWSPEKCATEEADALINRVQRPLARCFMRSDVPQSVFDMATSHAWNLGVSATCGSGAMQAWNRGEWERGCQRMSRGDDGKLVWSYVTQPDGSKKFVQGLANRRAAETAACMKDVK